jgi:predicted secreted protein
MSRVSLVPVFVLLAVVAGAPAAFAQPFQLDPDTRDQLTFGVSRKTHVENDEMTVTLAAVHIDVDAAAAADVVNETMGKALPRVRAVEGVKLRTGAYSTNSFYPQPSPPSRPREPRWRAEQELIVASRDFDALRSLVTDLQASLRLKSVGFALSDGRRIEEERRMRQAALRAFREDAELIRKALGYSGYEIVELRVSGQTADPLRRHTPVQISTDSSELRPVAPVVLEGGSSEVRGHVEARIQLLR